MDTPEFSLGPGDTIFGINLNTFLFSLQSYVIEGRSQFWFVLRIPKLPSKIEMGKTKVTGYKDPRDRHRR